MEVDGDEAVDMGWKVAEEPPKKRKGKKKVDSASEVVDIEIGSEEAAVRTRMSFVVIDGAHFIQERRTRLLKELSARLGRDKQLRYAERELEMQKQLMGKGGSRKVAGAEKVEEDDEDERESGDEGRPKKVDEKTWRPRVYKWRLERKR